MNEGARIHEARLGDVDGRWSGSSRKNRTCQIDTMNWPSFRIGAGEDAG